MDAIDPEAAVWWLSGMSLLLLSVATGLLIRTRVRERRSRRRPRL